MLGFKYKKKEKNNIGRNLSKPSKKRSKLVVDIINGNISVADALYKLKILLSDLENREVNEWIEAELTGYKTSDVPQYRKGKGYISGVFQAGYRIYNNINIPIKSEFADLSAVIITEDITTAETYSKANDDMTLGRPFDLGVINSIAALEIDEFSQIIKANIIIPKSKFTEIVNSVKQKILEILIDLEKKYGNLDEYYIDFSSKNDKDNTAKEIIKIIKIGDNNIIKNSNIGEKNEH